MNRSSVLKVVAFFMLGFALAGCGRTTPPPQASNASYYKVGQPYQVNDTWYYPREDYSYDETGIASWYGIDFHDHMTANGEIYNKDELTAAHKTLPLPCLARVTNLENGRSVVVRVNDRGPFSGARIIDVSQRSAQLLGFENQGTAKVRVQVLADESKAIADAMRRYGTPGVASAAPVQVAAASQVETKNIEPVQSTAETHRELLETKPVPVALQLPLTGRTHIFIQAGAFTVYDNAQRMQQRLAQLGSASISEIVINGTKFYRVRLGPVANVPQADSMITRVRQAGVPVARTVVD